MSTTQPLADLPTDPIDAARLAGLRYVNDSLPGIRRRRAGKGFTYLSPTGERITDSKTLERIRKLAIPPGWKDVWISPTPRGHIQATARDARGRKQYRYHERWHEIRDATKYGRMIAFGEALPRIRAVTGEHLALPGLPREKVLAAVLRLLERSLIRVGNEAYARENESYGLTTLRDEHLDVEGSKLRFRFRGKSGKEQEVALSDRRLARLMKRLQDLPGQELFQYRDEDGELRTIDSEDVNEYLREIAGEEFSAKDFRTWAGTLLAARTLSEIGPSESETEQRKKVVQAVDEVAQRLGNTRAVCRKCYIHPAVLSAYEQGALGLGSPRPRELAVPETGLSAEEMELLDLLRVGLEQEETGPPKRASAGGR